MSHFHSSREFCVVYPSYLSKLPFVQLSSQTVEFVDYIFFSESELSFSADRAVRNAQAVLL